MWSYANAFSGVIEMSADTRQTGDQPAKGTEFTTRHVRVS
jgi:hypothetical protein